MWTSVLILRSSDKTCLQSREQPLRSQSFLAVQVPPLIDTGATESSIHEQLAQQLQLPLIDQEQVSGISGTITLNIYLGHVVIPPSRPCMGGSPGCTFKLVGSITNALRAERFACLPLACGARYAKPPKAGKSRPQKRRPRDPSAAAQDDIFRFSRCRLCIVGFAGWFQSTALGTAFNLALRLGLQPRFDPALASARPLGICSAP